MATTANRKNEILGLVLMALMSLVGLSILSYDAGDMGYLACT